MAYMRPGDGKQYIFMDVYGDLHQTTPDGTEVVYEEGVDADLKVAMALMTALHDFLESNDIEVRMSRKGLFGRRQLKFNDVTWFDISEDD